MASYKLIGDGTWEKTKLLKDDKQVNFTKVTYYVDTKESFIIINSDVGCDKLDEIMIDGIYKIIGTGEYDNTRVFFMDEMLRGVQSINLKVEMGKPPLLYIQVIALPNIVEEVHVAD